MLSKGLRDEENKKMDRLFHDLSTIDFLPEYWENQQRADANMMLNDSLGKSLDEIEQMDSDVLLRVLEDQQFSLDNYEQLGDLLFRISAFEPEREETILLNHSIKIYQLVQEKSRTFDFRLDRKLKEAREAL